MPQVAPTETPIKWHSEIYPPQGYSLRVRPKMRHRELAQTEIENAHSGMLGSLGPEQLCETVIVVGFATLSMHDVDAWAFMDPNDEKILGGIEG